MRLSLKITRICVSHSPGQILVCAYKICSYGQILNLSTLLLLLLLLLLFTTLKFYTSVLADGFSLEFD